MKNNFEHNFHGDVDPENLDIANQIFEESQKLHTENAWDETLMQQILDGSAAHSADPKENLQHAPHRTRTKRNLHPHTANPTRKKIYRTAASIAACLVLFVGGVTIYRSLLWDVSTGKSSSGSQELEMSADADRLELTASSYEEIYQRLCAATSSNGDAILGLSGAIAEEDIASNAKDSASMKKTTKSADASSSTMSEDVASPSFYDTNIQTDSVQEGDVVKTAGDYIYTLRYVEKPSKYHIIITKADGMTLTHVADIAIARATKKSTSKTSTDGASKKNSQIAHKKYTNVKELYIEGDRLIIVSSVYTDYDYDYASVYDYIDSSTDTQTRIDVYDVSNRSKPQLIDQRVQDGHYISSRMQNGYLYTISSKTMGKVTKNNCVPSLDNEQMACDSIYLPETIDGHAYTVITTLDIFRSDAFCNSLAVAGNVSEVYASEDNLYLISNTTQEEDISDTEQAKKALENSSLTVEPDTKTKITDNMKIYLSSQYPDVDWEHCTAYRNASVYRMQDALQILKYRYDNGQMEYVAETQVAGHTFDNLNFDEINGYLRMVSTGESRTALKSRLKFYDADNQLVCEISDAWSGAGYDWYSLENTKTTSNVFVLDELLNKTAEITGLAKGETLYSSRFLGDYGYFVTYKNTDPLFSVDFTDIEHPKLIGELKIPGFSDYLHFYGEDKLFGFGLLESNKDISEDALKLEMYNIKNGNATTESKEVLSAYENSPALENYHAIMVDTPKGLIGFSACAYWGAPQEEASYLLYTYKNNRFQQLLKIDLDISEDYDAYATCENVRGFYIGDYLYVVNPDFGIHVVNLKTYQNDAKVGYETF